LFVIIQLHDIETSLNLTYGKKDKKKIKNGRSMFV